MSTIDEKFFNENVVQVNSIVSIILFVSAIVPLSFIILTLAGIWIVPHNYSLILLTVSVISAFTVKLFNNEPKNQRFAMYFGTMTSILFVALLGSENIIHVSVCFALPTFMSCLYYNKKLTRITALATYLVLAVVYIKKAQNTNIGDLYYAQPLKWYISNFLGVSIEFIFVFLLSNFMSKKTYKSLRDLVTVSEERNRVLENLLTQMEETRQLNNKLEQKNTELRKTQIDIIQFVEKCLGSHDLFTGRHIVHTQEYVKVICESLVKQGKYLDELTPDCIQLFVSAAFLHDIGKIHIPEGILNKVGRFTTEEFKMMKCHPEEGKKLLEFLPPIEAGSFNKAAENMCYCHHEKWDGSGYPQGLSGTQIPLEARIMAAADVLDALISQRLYKDPMSIDEAIEVFQKSKGSHFEECIAECVIQSKDIIKEIDSNFKATEAQKNLSELQWWLQYHEHKTS